MPNFLYPVPAQPPADGVQHTCTFGDDWLAIILDRMDDLQSGDWFDSPPSDIKQQIRELLDLLEIDTTPPPQVSPAFDYWSGASRQVVTGNPILLSGITGQFHGYTTLQSTAAINDQTKLVFRGKAGIYTISQLGSTNNNRGKVLFQIDGVDFDDIDFYSSGQVLNVVTQSAFEALTDGEHTITMKVYGKRAASSDYVYAVTALWLTPQF